MEVEVGKNIGVYAIKNTMSNKYYIGSSIHINERIKCHFYSLNSNKHFNNDFQNDFNKYGEGAFEFNVIQNCSISELIEVEQYFIDKYNTRCYNKRTSLLGSYIRGKDKKEHYQGTDIFSELYASEIKRVRKEQRYSQKGLADLCGINQQEISLYESGKRTPSQDSLDIIAKSLGKKWKIKIELK